MLLALIKADDTADLKSLQSQQVNIPALLVSLWRKEEEGWTWSNLTYPEHNVGVINESGPGEKRKWDISLLLKKLVL